MEIFVRSSGTFDNVLYVKLNLIGVYRSSVFKLKHACII